MIACSTSIASSTLRVIGPSLSSDQQSVIAPVRGTRPNVGRSPVTPQRIAGAMMLPPVSLPIEKPTSAAAVAAPGPALEPDAPSSSSHGFIVWPPNQMSFSASAPSVSFATSTAPASFSRRRPRRVGVGHAIAKRLGALRRRDARGVEQVLHAIRNAVQRTAVPARGDLGVGRARLPQRVVAA